jgi:hypothetical protein
MHSNDHILPETGLKEVRPLIRLPIERYRVVIPSLLWWCRF